LTTAERGRPPVLASATFQACATFAGTVGTAARAKGVAMLGNRFAAEFHPHDANPPVGWIS